MLGSATAESYARRLPLILADPGIDALIVLFVPPVAVSADDVGAAIAAAAAAGPPEKPVLGLDHRGAGGAPATLGAVPSFAYPESAARALGRACRARRLAARLVGDGAGARPESTTPPRQRSSSGRSPTPSDAWLTPDDARALLEAYGIPIVGERVVESADEAVAAAAELGYPGRREDGGGRRAQDRAGRRRARPRRTSRQFVPRSTRIGMPVLVQPMVQGGAELLAGVVQDPVFGPLVAFGPGGVLAELIGDAEFRLAPLTDVDADELVTTGKAGRLVARLPRAPAVGRASRSPSSCCGSRRLAEDLPEVAELDLNPVIGLAHGCVAVDARIRVAPGRPVQPARRPGSGGGARRPR